MWIIIKESVYVSDFQAFNALEKRKLRKMWELTRITQNWATDIAKTVKWSESLLILWSLQVFKEMKDALVRMK